MSDARRLLGRLLLLLPVPVVMAVTTLAVDPANLFESGYEDKVAAILLRGKNVANLENYDERRLEEAYLGRARPISVLVLGSSRALSIRGTDFPGQAFYNASVSGASLEDVLAIRELAERAGPLRCLVLGVDPWYWNESAGQGRWTTIAQAYGLARRRLGLPVGSEVDAASSRGPWLRYLQVLSPTYFQASLQEILAGTGRRSRDVRETDAEEASVSVKRADGSLAYPESLRSRTTGDVERLALEYAGHSPIYSLGNFRELDPARREVFERLLDDLHARGTRVVFFLAPYHPLVYDVLASRPEYAQVLAAERYAREQAERRSIRVVGSFSPGACGVEARDFLDGMHLRSVAVERLVAPIRER
jgi:hypothetical protein